MKNLLRTVYRLYATFSRAPKVAVVGSGPAGMYVCTGVLRKLPTCELDVFDASPVPYGLVRYGVAPDHPEVKNCIKQFDKMFATNQERISLYCNVAIGHDLKFEELLADYDAVVLAYGARKQRKLMIPGIDAKNVFSGGDFVSWYNGFPNAKCPSLDCENAVIIGNGNVALDCCRILLSARNGRLSNTDIPSPVLDSLLHSTVRNVTIVGRRGPLEVSFTIKELREQINLPDCSFSAEIEASDEQAITARLETLPRPRKRLTELLVQNSKPDLTKQKRCHLLFRRTPTEILADVEGRIRSVVLKNTRTQNLDELPCGLLIYSIGYENLVLDGVPKNQDGKIDLKDGIRVNVPGETLVYASGWCAHAPRGVIGDTQAQIDSTVVAAALCSDLERMGIRKTLKTSAKQRLESRGVNHTSWEDWKEIDEAERLLGKAHHKEREKLTYFNPKKKMI